MTFLAATLTASDPHDWWWQGHQSFANIPEVLLKKMLLFFENNNRAWNLSSKYPLWLPLGISLQAVPEEWIELAKLPRCACVFFPAFCSGNSISSFLDVCSPLWWPPCPLLLLSVSPDVLLVSADPQNKPHFPASLPLPLHYVAPAFPPSLLQAWFTLLCAEPYAKNL